MAETTLHLVAKADEREAARILDEASATFVQAVKEVRVMSAELERCFAQIEESRRVLDNEGMSVRIQFDPAISAAYLRWRELNPQRELAELPRSLR